MARMAEKKTVVVHGGNGEPARLRPSCRPIWKRRRTWPGAIAANSWICTISSFTTICSRRFRSHLMFRYNFVPLEETDDGRLAIAIADPSQLMMIDEISLLLSKRILTKVSTLAQISEILKKTEQSKRVLEEASEGFTLAVVHEEAGGEESISIDRLTAQGDISPIIRLVDTTIFTALQRRASDIHIETQDDSVVHQVPH